MQEGEGCVQEGVGGSCMHERRGVSDVQRRRVELYAKCLYEEFGKHRLNQVRVSLL